MTERSAQGRWVIRFIVVVAAASATLLGAEMYVRVAAPDAPLLQGLLYFAVGDRPSHQYDPDPDLLYRLKPGRAEYQTHIVTINEHGARGPDLTAAKPPGTFRIFVLGGSNVYGAVLNDDETWPAQLEARLNETTGPPVEVWNFGVSAYVGVQMAALGREVTERLNPDP
ncbi:MAG: hypothetical protein M5R36_17035 [Deltaproteobacteria bacterium]|nr:hypothetical protein [Deltaproteobacteria bacterium]